MSCFSDISIKVLTFSSDHDMYVCECHDYTNRKYPFPAICCRKTCLKIGHVLSCSLAASFWRKFPAPLNLCKKCCSHTTYSHECKSLALENLHQKLVNLNVVLSSRTRKVSRNVRSLEMFLKTKEIYL